MTPALPPAVDIREVGPRDGLQGEAPVAPEDRARLVEALLDTGIRRIEAVSFVSPKAVPAMAHPQAVLSAIPRRTEATICALVPNMRGAAMALEAGVDVLTVTIAASPEYNRRNVHMSIDESVQAIADICARSSEAGVPVDAVVSCAFGSPYEGDIPAGEVAELAARLRRAGAQALTLADTTGMATPRVLAEVLAATGTDVGLHLHDTRGSALLNAYAAMELGVSRFDTSVGGLGGSPFAESAAGNLATEDFVALLDDLKVRTGVSLDRLLAAGTLAEQLVGHPLPGHVSRVGSRLAGAGGSPPARAGAASPRLTAPPVVE